MERTRAPVGGLQAIHLGVNQLERAAVDYVQAIDLGARDGELGPNLMFVAFQLSDVLRFPEARAAYQGVVKFFEDELADTPTGIPQSAHARKQLAWSSFCLATGLSSIGRIADAEEQYRRTLELNPGNLWARIGLRGS